MHNIRLKDAFKIDDNKWWERPNVTTHRKLRFGPSKNPINWGPAANLVKFIVDVYDHFRRRDLKLIEIGSFCCESSSMFAGSGIFEKIDLIDPWWEQNNLSICEYNMRKYPFVTMHQTTSERANKSWKESVDIVYIDANHTYESVKNDIKLWTPFIKKGGILSGHDYGAEFEGVIKAVEEVGKPVTRYRDGSWIIKL